MTLEVPRAARKGQGLLPPRSSSTSGLLHAMQTSPPTPLLLLALLLLLHSTPQAHAQSAIVPCSSCNSCSGSSCSSCQFVFASACANGAGWCSGCSNCNGSACATCSSPGFSVGCSDWYYDSDYNRANLAFLYFILIAFVFLLVAWAVFRFSNRRKQQEALRLQNEATAAQNQELSMTSTYNPNYAMNPADPNTPAAQPLPRPQEPYHYYYATTSLPSPAAPPPTAYPAYPAPPPGYPGTPGSAYFTSQPPAAPPVLPVSTGFSSRDELTPAAPLPVSDPLASPAPARSGRQRNEHRQSLLSQDQQGSNSSSIL